MVALALARWLFVALFHRPATWLVLGLAVAVGWLLPGLSPSLPGAERDLAWMARWGMPAGLTGSALAAHLLRTNCDFLRWAAPTASWCAHGMFLVGAATAVQLALGLGWWSAAAAGGPSPGLMAGLVLLDVHLAALALLLLAARLAPGTSALALVVLVWTASAWAADGGAGPLGPLLDVAGHPGRFLSFAEAPKTAVLHAAPVAAMTLCSWLLRSPTAGSLPDPAA